jgi:hypothetical protein
MGLVLEQPLQEDDAFSIDGLVLEGSLFWRRMHFQSMGLVLEDSLFWRMMQLNPWASA